MGDQQEAGRLGGRPAAGQRPAKNLRIPCNVTQEPTDARGLQSSSRGLGVSRESGCPIVIHSSRAAEERDPLTSGNYEGAP